MQHLPADPANQAERWAWLQAEQERYWSEPSQSADQIPAAQALFDQLQCEAPSDFGVALVAHLVTLFVEDGRGLTAGPLLEVGLDWTERGLGSHYRIYLLMRSCRRHAHYGDGEQAGVLLAKLIELNADTAVAMEDRAHYLWARAACLNLKQDVQREIECLQDAAKLYQEAGWKGPWVIAYTSIAILYRRLGETEKGLASSQTAVDLSLQQRRWDQVCNALTGVAEACLELGDIARTNQVVSDASAYLPRLSGATRQRYESEVLAAQAKCFAAQQDFAGAAALMQRSIATASKVTVINAQRARRLRDLAPWLVHAGEGAQALLALEQAHALELEDFRKSSQKSLTHALEKAELQHALVERERAQAHAQALELRNKALTELLHVQRELQDELIASSRLASLGNLLAGMSHELNTPLGVALTALSTLVERAQGLNERVQAAAVSRTGLLADVVALVDGGALSLSNVERAIGLIASYKELVADVPEVSAELAAKQPMLALVRTAWYQALAPDSLLSLELDVADHLSVSGDALSDVLLQLFQNVARHAYAPGQHGAVRVSAGREGHQLWLHVQDHGQGIAADLLPRIFDPYVSTQFGQGRSGLGLFQAQAQVSKGLKGRLTVKSEQGHGARFAIEWLQLEFEPEALRLKPKPEVAVDGDSRCSY